MRGVCNVLDIGGRAEDWMALKDVWGGRNIFFTIVNLCGSCAKEGRFTWIIGDACNLARFQDHEFDVVYSNSVVEHVGDWANKRRMANEVRRLAPQYFVQTPSFWFPFEPHLRLPLIHWLPAPLQRAAVKRRAWGFYRKAQDHHEAYEILSETALLDRDDMIALFPEAEIVKEKFGFICKSLMAIRKI
jgi:ubiquinone/menaquinone biosynthesis C-methylase UbiE